MNNEQGGVSFGFSPQGRPGQRPTEKPKKFQINEKVAATARYNASSYSYPTSKSNLAWLCIGILLGAGLTLIGSSFWLQGSYVNPSVAMDAGTTKSRDREQNAGGPLSRRATETTLIKQEAKGNVAKLPNDTKPVVETSKSTRDSAVEFEQKAKADVKPAPRPSSDPSTDLARAELSATTPVKQNEALLIGSNADQDPAAGNVNQKPLQQAGARDYADPNVKKILERAKLVLANDPVSDEDDEREPSVTSTSDVKAKELETAALDNTVQSVSQTVEKDEITALIKAGTPKRTTSGRIYRVQLAAVDTERAAEVFWREARSRIPDLFTGIEPTFDRGEVDKRIFYRIWIGEFEKRGDADNYCGQLKTKGQDCFVTRG